MRTYLQTLKKEIDDEKWTYMIVNAHDETFEPVYQSNEPFTPSGIKAIYSANVSKSANQSMAYISLVCAPEKMEDGCIVIGPPWVL